MCKSQLSNCIHFNRERDLNLPASSALVFKIICDLLVILHNIFQYSLGYGTQTLFYTRMTWDAYQNGKPEATLLLITPQKPIR